MVKMFGKPIRVNQAARDQQVLEVGANIFVGNLDAEVDEKLLYDTFSAFGVIVTTPKIMRDGETGNSRGFGFVSFESFEASDAAIEAMNGQFLCNRPVSCTYAIKKDSKGSATAPPPSGCSRRTTRSSRTRTPTNSSGWGPTGAMGAPPPMGAGAMPPPPPGMPPPPPGKPPPPGRDAAAANGDAAAARLECRRRPPECRRRRACPRPRDAAAARNASPARLRAARHAAAARLRPARLSAAAVRDAAAAGKH